MKNLRQHGISKFDNIARPIDSQLDTLAKIGVSSIVGSIIDASSITGSIIGVSSITGS